MKKQILNFGISKFGIMTMGLMLFLASCSKNDEVIQPVNSGSKANVKIIGETFSTTLLAGQFTPVGTVSITDNGTSFTVKYEAYAGYSFSEIHFWYGASLDDMPVNNGGNPQIGLFDYNYPFNTPQEEFSFDVPYLSLDWECGEFFAAAHAVFGTETAWGQGTEINPGGGSWAMYFEPAFECPDDDDEDGGGDDECTVFNYETAFGGNSTGAGNAWWYYYNTTTGGVQNIYAGRTMVAGTVEYSAGAITITLIDGWELDPDASEPVKIQGYQTPPNKRPAAGLFTTYKGDALTVNVDYFNFYVIHLDVRICAEE